MDYWNTMDGIFERVKDIAHYFTWGSINNAIKGLFGSEPEAKTLVWKNDYPDPCEVCYEGIGTTYTSDDTMLPDLPDDMHPKCLPGFVRVSASSRITGATKRMYKGNLIIITTSGGRNLTVTPNHPILTEKGWIPANLVNVGTNVVCERISHLGFFTNHNHENMPTELKQVVNTFLHLPSTLRLKVPTTPKDFHNDGKGSKVAVVGTNRHLMLNNMASSSKHVRELPLITRNTKLPRLNNFSVFNFLSQGSLTSSSGNMCVPKLVFALRSIHLTPLQQFSLLSPSNVNSCENQSLTNGVSFDLKTVSELFLRNSLDVEFDQVVNVQVFPKYHGNIYNLETMDGYFNAEGIIVHNCRCYFDVEGKEDAE